MQSLPNSEPGYQKFTTRFNDLPSKNPVTIAEYIWIGGTGMDLRSKTMCIHRKCTQLSDFPEWNFDGSSTLQAATENSEVVLRPVFFCNDPFRYSPAENDTAVLVLCETFLNDFKTPAKGNFRYLARQVFESDVVKTQYPWFGWEQEYILLQHEGTFKWPIGFPKGGFAHPQGQYYCGNGSSNAIARFVAEAHMKACLNAGITVSGLNAEVFPGQWEFQVGPVEGINGCDQLWMARYILTRIGEEFDVDVTFEPKPVKGDWNGSGCHTNFSYVNVRGPGSKAEWDAGKNPQDDGKTDYYENILQAMKDLATAHDDHIYVYGPENELRMTGKHETASIDKFSYGVANRGSSARIPTNTVMKKKGYFEDRRPSANCDPYLVGGMLCATCIMRNTEGETIKKNMVEGYKKFMAGLKEATGH